MFGNFKNALPTYHHFRDLQSSEISALVHNLMCKFSWNRQFLHEKHSKCLSIETLVYNSYNKIFY